MAMEEQVKLESKEDTRAQERRENDTSYSSATVFVDSEGAGQSLARMASRTRSRMLRSPAQVVSSHDSPSFRVHSEERSKERGVVGG